MHILRRLFALVLTLSVLPLGVFALTPQRAIYRQLNSSRSLHHRSQLVLSTRLSKVAQQRAEFMAEAGVFSHTIPGKPSPWEMVRTTRYTFTKAGEVIGLNHRDPKKLIRAWELSTPHRTVIYSTKYNQVGVGQATVKNNKNMAIITVVIFAYHPKNTP